MNVQIITLFPELFQPFQQAGLVSRALDTGVLELSTIQLRDFAINTHGQVDDTPYGGGSGMVMRPDSGVAAIRHAKKINPSAKVLLFSPRGIPLKQKKVRELASEKGGLILLCPRYEGVDERLVESEVDEEVSLGDFVLMGGEIAAQALVEAIARLLPGVLNNNESSQSESFESGLLEYSQYTKPRDFEGAEVPAPLLTGNHKVIEVWKKNNGHEETAKRRPDLFKGPVKSKCPVSVALMHYPVLGKQGEIITSSLTNIDIHDIARSCKTYGLDRFYIVHPVRALRRLAEKIQGHWLDGYGSTYNPNRKEAIELISLVPHFDDVLMDMESRFGTLPQLAVTSASEMPESTSFETLRHSLLTDINPHLILFGTGWGMAPELIEQANIRLEPIVGPTEWNHLSVRSAVAITFDRLFGGANRGLRNY